MARLAGENKPNPKIFAGIIVANLLIIAGLLEYFGIIDLIPKLGREGNLTQNRPAEQSKAIGY